MDLTDPQSWNGYAYVSNRPLTDTDPSGRDAITANTPGFSLNGQPAPPTTTPASDGWSLFDFSFSWGGNVSSVMTLKTSLYGSTPQFTPTNSTLPQQQSPYALTLLRPITWSAPSFLASAPCW